MAFQKPAIAVQHPAQWILTPINLYTNFGGVSEVDENANIANVMQRRQHFVSTLTMPAQLTCARRLPYCTRRCGKTVDVTVIDLIVPAKFLYSLKKIIVVASMKLAKFEWSIFVVVIGLHMEDFIAIFLCGQFGCKCSRHESIWQSERLLANQFSLFHEFSLHRANRTRFAFDSTLL